MKQTKLYRAIEKLEQEIEARKLAIQSLRDLQRTKPASVRKSKVAESAA